MGIQGLLPLLKDIQVKTHVSSFKGQAVGIDTYCWLHKGTYSCAKDLILGKPTKAYVQYVMKRVHMLKNYGLKPILVFDGGHLPAKREKEKERRKNRENYKKQGMTALREGKSKEAYECFQKACDVTPRMAGEIIKECYKIGVQCIVAPYEADAQLAYLMKNDITQLTISEDSDLLLYGCNKVLYKMNADGDGLLIDLANLKRVRSVQLSSFTFEKFRHMCMLSGCDYLPSIKGMGLKKAFQAIKKHRTAIQTIRYLKCDRTYNVPEDYEKNFQKSETVFIYQLVFDPRQKKVVHLNQMDDTVQLDEESLNFAGPKIGDEKAFQIALGNIDPISGDVLGDIEDFAHEAREALSTSERPERSNNSAFKFSNNKVPFQANPVKETAPSPDIPSTDCTPTSEENYKEIRTISKCLDDVMPKMTSDATKSLKLLDNDKDEKMNHSPLKKLYSTVNEDDGKKKVSKSLWLTAKKKIPTKHKFKNPFRIKETFDNFNEKEVKSCYFGGDSNDQTKVENNCLTTTENIDEPLLFEKEKKISPRHPPGRFIEYLDSHNLSMSSAPRKRLTLDTTIQSPKKHKSPRRKSSKQRKINDISSILSRYSNNLKCEKETIDNRQINKENNEPIFILSTPEKNPRSNEVVTPEERSPLSPVMLSQYSNVSSSQMSVDFAVISSAIPEAFINSHSPQKSEIDTEPKDDADNEEPLMSKKLSKPPMKIGLSKKNKRSAAVNKSSVQKITNMLETFKKFDKNSLPIKENIQTIKTLNGKEVCDRNIGNESRTLDTENPLEECDTVTEVENRSNNDEVEIIISDDDDEEVLPKSNPQKKTAGCSILLKYSDTCMLERCKSVGLSRKRKIKTSISNDNKKKQTKLTLEKFRFEKKSLVLS